MMKSAMDWLIDAWLFVFSSLGFEFPVVENSYRMFSSLHSMIFSFLLHISFYFAFANWNEMAVDKYAILDLIIIEALSFSCRVIYWLIDWIIILSATGKNVLFKKTDFWFDILQRIHYANGSRTEGVRQWRARTAHHARCAMRSQVRLTHRPLC